MAKGISIGIASDTREFASGVKKGVIEPLEDAADALDDVADALDDVGRDGDKAGKKLEDAFEDARKETSKFKDEQSELGRVMQRASKQGGDSIRDNYKKGTAEAGEGLKEFKDEAKSTAKESAASFDGSAESIASGFQEVAANAFAGFGPAGELAGLAAAAGIGIAIAAFNKAAEEAQVAKERAGELTAELIDNQGSYALDNIIDRLKQIATETAEGKENLSEWRDLAKLAGVPFKDLAEDMADISQITQQEIDLLQKEVDALLESGNLYDENTRNKGDALERIIRKKEEDLLASEAAKAGEEAYLATGGPEWERKAALIETVNEAYDDAAGAASDYIVAESGLFDTSAYITAMNEKRDALLNYQETLATSPLTPEAKAFLDSQGAESAATFLAGYKAATPEQQRELERIWNEAGSTSSGSYTAALTAGIPNEVAGPRVVASGDAYGVLAEMQRQIDNNPLVARVTTKYDRFGSLVP